MQGAGSGLDSDQGRRQEVGQPALVRFGGSLQLGGEIVMNDRAVFCWEELVSVFQADHSKRTCARACGMPMARPGRGNAPVSLVYDTIFLTF